jgi:hypothetical protein
MGRIERRLVREVHLVHTVSAASRAARGDECGGHEVEAGTGVRPATSAPTAAASIGLA